MPHTPGPWEWRDRGGYHSLVAIGDYGTHPNGQKVEPEIMDDGSAGAEYSPSIDVNSADAQLIAAAPDMLALLIELQWAGADEDGEPACPSCGAWGLHDPTHRDYCRLAALITRAKGEATDAPRPT